MSNPVGALVVMTRRLAPPLLRALDQCGVRRRWVSTRADAQRALREEAGEFEVVLTAEKLPDGEWRDLLQAGSPAPEVIVCLKNGKRSACCELIQNGAYDVLNEEFNSLDTRNLQRLLDAAAARHRMRCMSAAADGRRG